MPGTRNTPSKGRWGKKATQSAAQAEDAQAEDQQGEPANNNTAQGEEHLAPARQVQHSLLHQLLNPMIQWH